MTTMYKVMTCVLFPCVVSFLVQKGLKHEYMKIVPKLASKHMDNEGPVEGGETSASETEPPEVQQLPASPARTRVSPPVSAQTPQVTPKLKIDVAGWLKEGIASDASRSSMTFFEYKPVVACETRTIKVMLCPVSGVIQLFWTRTCKKMTFAVELSSGSLGTLT